MIDIEPPIPRRSSLTPSNGVARRFESHQIVRVAAFKETSRSDESVLYQQMILVQPGTYDLELSTP